MNNLVVIVPIYKNTLSKEDLISLLLCSKHLNRYDIIVISPESLREDEKHLMMIEQYNLNTKYFNNFFFSGIDGYNKLMLDLIFYESFSEYRYMLICQLDTLIFSGDLSYWMNKDYDYVGSPWVANGENIILDSMGNGGLSLRKVSKFVEVLKSKEFYYSNAKFFGTSTRAGLKNLLLLRLFYKLKSVNYSLNFKGVFLMFYTNNEDVFWAFFAKFFTDDFKLSTVEDALKFSFEENPSFCLNANNYELPFGCHAWERYDVDFWIKNVEELSFSLKSDHD